MPDINTNTNTQADLAGMEPDQATRLLDLELKMKRVEWQKAKEKRRGVRTITFVFLFLVLCGGGAAFFFLFTKAQERGSLPQPSASQSAKP